MHGHLNSLSPTLRHGSVSFWAFSVPRIQLISPAAFVSTRYCHCLESIASALLFLLCRRYVLFPRARTAHIFAISRFRTQVVPTLDEVGVAASRHVDVDVLSIAVQLQGILQCRVLLELYQSVRAQSIARVESLCSERRLLQEYLDNCDAPDSITQCVEEHGAVTCESL